MPGDSKRYSIENYDKLKPSDFVDIFNAFTDRHSCSLKIMRFLANNSKNNSKNYRSIPFELVDHDENNDINNYDIRRYTELLS